MTSHIAAIDAAFGELLDVMGDLPHGAPPARSEEELLAWIEAMNALTRAAFKLRRVAADAAHAAHEADLQAISAAIDAVPRG